MDAQERTDGLRCPDPECGGEVSMLAGGSMGALCGLCGKRWSTLSFAQRLAQVQAELEEERKRPTWRALNAELRVQEIEAQCVVQAARIAELEGALRTIERSALSGYVKNVASRALAKQGAEPVEGGDDGE